MKGWSLMAVTVLTLPNCVQCEQTKKFLKKHFVDFQEFDLVENPAILSVLRVAGHTQSPVVLTDDENWSGFRPDLLEKIVKDSV